MAGAVEDAAAAAAAAGPDKPKKRSSPDALDGPSSKAAKAPVDERAFVVSDSVKSLGQNIARQQGGVASRISVVPGAASKLLCVITNDVLAAKRRMEENGNKELFIVSATLLQVMEPAGFLNAPYEPAAHVPIKSRSFTDKDGKPLDSCKPVQLAQVQRATIRDGEPPAKVMTFRSYESHPKPALNTKCRGAVTDIVGAAHPGLPFNFMAYADACKITSSESDEEGVSLLKRFSVALLGIRVKSKEKCDKGYGMTLSSIEVLGDLDATMCGLYPDFRAYTAFAPIGPQTEALLGAKRFTTVMDSDLHFIRHLFRQHDKFDTVSERPMVTIAADDVGPRTEVLMSAGNDGLLLQIDDERNIYRGKPLEIHIPDNAFSARTRAGGLPWLQQLYSWLLGARACQLVVVHDDYRFQQADAARGLTSFVVADYARVFAAGGTTLFRASHVASLKDATKRDIDPGVMLEDTSLRYSAWTVYEDRASGLSYAVIVDNTGAKNAKKLAHSEDDAERHSSVFCQMYDGMAPARAVHIAYLVVMDKAVVKSALPVGIRDVQQAQSEGAAALSAMVALPVDVVDVTGIFD